MLQEFEFKGYLAHLPSIKKECNVIMSIKDHTKPDEIKELCYRCRTFQCAVNVDFKLPVERSCNDIIMDQEMKGK